MPIAKCGDVNLEYYDEGSGPPLLMIMGLGGQASSWGEPLLNRMRESFRTIRFSNRGTGDSSRPAEQFTIRTMAGDAVALLDGLSVDRAHVFGVSMGGMIAQELALAYPERVEGLVLGCTTAGGPMAAVAGEEVLAMLLPQPGLSREEQIRKSWPAITTQWMLDDKTFLETMLAASLEKPTPMETLPKQVVAVQTFDAYERVPQISAPTLIIHGDADRLVPPENGRILHERIAGSRLEMLPAAAHVFFWEYPEEAAKTITSFLAQEPATR